jgi:hypothetical protein
MLKILSMMGLLIAIGAFVSVLPAGATQRAILGKLACEKSSDEGTFARYEVLAEEMTGLMGSTLNRTSDRIEISKDKAATFSCKLKGISTSGTVLFDKVITAAPVKTVTPAETSDVRGEYRQEFEVFRNSTLIIHSVEYVFIVRRARKVSDRKTTDEITYSVFSKLRISKVNPDGSVVSIKDNIVIRLDQASASQSLTVAAVDGEFTLECAIQ